MSDLVPTQFEFERSGAINEDFDCEPATLSVGDVVHFTALDTWDLASNASVLLAGVNGLGMVTQASTVGNPVRVLIGNALINLGTAIGLATNEIILAATAGKMAPAADLASTEIYTRLGWMETTDLLRWNPLRTGVAKA